MNKLFEDVAFETQSIIEVENHIRKKPTHKAFKITDDMKPENMKIFHAKNKSHIEKPEHLVVKEKDKKAVIEVPSDLKIFEPVRRKK